MAASLTIDVCADRSRVAGSVDRPPRTSQTTASTQNFGTVYRADSERYKVVGPWTPEAKPRRVWKAAIGVRRRVEQKNGAVVRQLVGYDRFTSRAAYAQLTRVYRLARLHVNFFQPAEKLVTKTRHGARVHRVYDRAHTPYQRLCAAGIPPADARRELEALYQSLSPLQLRRALDRERERLWTLAAPDPRRPTANTEIAPPPDNRS
jgi:hypothetical protein